MVDKKKSEWYSRGGGRIGELEAGGQGDRCADWRGRNDSGSPKRWERGVREPEGIAATVTDSASRSTVKHEKPSTVRAYSLPLLRGFAFQRAGVRACVRACVRAYLSFPRCGDPRLGCIVRDRAWVRARARAPSRLRCTDDLGKLRDPAWFSRCNIVQRRLGFSVSLSSGSMLWKRTSVSSGKMEGSLRLVFEAGLESFDYVMSARSRKDLVLRKLLILDFSSFSIQWENIFLAEWCYETRKHRGCWRSSLSLLLEARESGYRAARIELESIDVCVYIYIYIYILYIYIYIYIYIHSELRKSKNA